MVGARGSRGTVDLSHGGYVLSETTFAELGVNDAIVAALQAEGINSPFPIQSLAIPLGLKGVDLVGQARTGTGKTLAFGIPILQRISLDHSSKQPQALVMCPTRELALQVSHDIETVGAGVGARVLTVYGGVGYDTQLEGLDSGVDVVVGTPGRLLDLKNRGNLDLSQVSILVLDEADEMLDLGFLPDVEKLVSAVPRSRQALLFSATMPAEILALARANLHQPVNIRAEAADEATTVPETTQFVYQAHDLDKPTIVGKLLQTPAASRVMIFCTTKRQVERLATELKSRGFKVTSLHGDRSQAVREKSLAKFRSGKAQAIICTDVAARGIDIDLVSHVVNYDCPDDEKTYVHRIGRTGRAGNRGIAVTLVDGSDVPRWNLINKALNLPFADPPESYSTTPELLADLGIPEDATGRLISEAEGAALSAPADERKSSRSKGGKAKGSARRESGRRTRRSNGVVVRQKAPQEGQAPSAQTVSPEPSDSAPIKSRRRRRSSSHKKKPEE